MSLKTVLVCGLLSVVSSVTAQPNEQLAKCRSIQDASARLSCYDALPLSATSQPQQGQAPATFGLPDANAGRDSQSIQSAVPAGFTGWRGTTRIPLENGQVWEIVDGSSGYIGPENRKVVVRRGALGSFRMEFEGLNNSPSVRRIK